ncbi:MAG: 50S ribosomal protein L9, partial [Spirochaetales bacterium]|nr:50S ribosomal protein L9 [Spirochaetales bacterium]
MNTKVILVQDVKNLGEEGDVREVARGYARNFLLPRKFVVPYTKGNLALLETRRAVIEKRKEEKRRQAQGIKERIESEILKIFMPMGDNGKLFGSVTNATLADELQKTGIIVERKRIEVPGHTLKSQGNYKIKVRLYENEEASLSVAINPKEEEKSAAVSAAATVSAGASAAVQGEQFQAEAP